MLIITVIATIIMLIVTASTRTIKNVTFFWYPKIFVIINLSCIQAILLYFNLK